MMKLSNLTSKQKAVCALVVGLAAVIWMQERRNTDGGKTDRSDARSIYQLADDIAGDRNIVGREVVEDELSQSVLDAVNTETPVASVVQVPEKRTSKEQLRELVGRSASASGPESSKASSGGSLWDHLDRDRNPETTTLNETHDSVTTGETNNAATVRRISYQRRSRVQQETSKPQQPPAQVQFNRDGKMLTFSMADQLESGVGKGAKVNHVLGAAHFSQGALLKNGSKYLGVIEEPIRLVQGEKQPVEIMVLGKLSPHSVEVPFLLVGEAEMNKNRSRILVKVTHCIDPRSSSKAVECAGRVRDFEGYDGLGGKATSPAFAAIFAKVVSTVFSGMLLSDLTRSVTESGVLVDQTQSNKVLQGLAEGIGALGDEIGRELRAQGHVIEVAGPSVVRVRITRDSELW